MLILLLFIQYFFKSIIDNPHTSSEFRSRGYKNLIFFSKKRKHAPRAYLFFCFPGNRCYPSRFPQHTSSYLPLSKCSWWENRKFSLALCSIMKIILFFSLASRFTYAINFPWVAESRPAITSSRIMTDASGARSINFRISSFFALLTDFSRNLQ